MATTTRRRDHLLRLITNATPGTTDPTTDYLTRTNPAGNLDYLSRPLTAPAWIIGTVYAVGDIITLVASGAVMRCTVAGTSHASTAPTAPAYGATVTDNTATWQRIHN